MSLILSEKPLTLFLAGVALSAALCSSDPKIKLHNCARPVKDSQSYTDGEDTNILKYTPPKSTYKRHEIKLDLHANHKGLTSPAHAQTLDLSLDELMKIATSAHYANRPWSALPWTLYSPLKPKHLC